MIEFMQRLWKLEVVFKSVCWALVQTQQISEELEAGGNGGHEESKTKGRVFGALSLLTPFNHLFCLYMKLASIPLKHAIPTKQPSTRVHNKLDSPISLQQSTPIHMCPVAHFCQ